ncbi:MAG: TetR/AcrR family transcriptional regulator [Myxococcota bacterium]
MLDATVTELAENGYRALRFENVAARAKVARTTVYRRWPTKADLVRAALEAMPGSTATVPDTGDLRKDLIALGMRGVHFSQTTHGRALMRLFAADAGEEELHSLLQTFRRERDRGANAILEAAVRRGELPDLATARMIGELLPAAIFHRGAVRNQKLTRRFIERLVDFLLQAA